MKTDSIALLSHTLLVARRNDNPIVYHADGNHSAFQKLHLSVQCACVTPNPSDYWCDRDVPQETGNANFIHDPENRLSL